MSSETITGGDLDQSLTAPERLTRARPSKPGWIPETPISIRFEPEMIKRLDRIADQLSRVNANIRVGRSSVIKLATERALAAIEAELSIAAASSASI